jgi:ATP-dependent RNA helicase RhlE
VRAERVFKAMERVGIETVTIHGDKEQEDRFEAMKRFSDGEVKVLIATDITARGIDIKKIEYAINYDIPDVAENYVHRVGRTGRGVDKGFAISFCSEEEIPLLEAVEEFIGSKIDVLEIDKKDVQATLDFSTEVKPDLKSLLKEIADYEAFQKSKKKKKKK